MLIRIHLEEGVWQSNRKIDDSAVRGARALRAAELFFWITGGLALAVAGVAWAYGYLFQWIESRRFEAKLDLRDGASWRRALPEHSGLPGSPGAMPPIHRGDPFARVDIPRLGISSMIVEGVDMADLNAAVGHIPGTAFPGHAGNTAIAGHRDTFFRELRKIQRGDRIEITTLYGRYLYAVESTRIVPPTQTDVLKPTGSPTLTLVTCYPFFYIGSAPKRFIVRARMESE